MKVFFDIETIPGGEKLTLEQIEYPKKLTKKESIDNWWKSTAPLEEIEAEYRRRSVITYKCQVICLATAVDDEDPVCYIGSENEIFAAFENALNKKVSSQMEAVDWIGFNIKLFDFPIMRQRAFKYNFEYLKFNYLKKYDNRIFDIMERFLFPATGYISMKEVASFLGVKVKEGLDGSKVYDAWLAGNQQQIYDYCIDDVIAEREIYYRMCEK